MQSEKRTARLAGLLWFASTLTGGVAIALLVLTHPDFLSAFTPVQRNAMAMLLLRINNGLGQGVIELFWTPYFVSFSLLVIKSRLLPKILGFLLITMGTGFAINVLDKFLVPQVHPAMFTQGAMMLGALGGIPTMFWLLINGAADRPPNDPTGFGEPAPS